MTSPGGVMKVTYASIDDLATGCTSASAQLTSEIDTMNSQVSSLVASGWLGKASVNFQAEEKKWATAAEDLAQLLLKVAATLTQSSQAYNTTETGNAAMFAQ